MALIDGLEDYERMMARSLALWDNALEEIERADTAASGITPGDAHSMRLAALRSSVGALRVSLPADPGIQREKAGLWHDLEQEMDYLHKRIVHAMPDREYAHRKLRVIEELLANLKLLQLRDRLTP